MSSGVAVVVVNWNSDDLLGQCLSSLGRQNLPPDKIIVVDNASTDGSAAGIEARYRNTKVIQLDTNTGFAAGNNIGVDAAKDCDWIALVNPDVCAEPDWLERIISAAKENPEYAFFGSRMLAANQSNRLDGTADVYHVSGAHWRRSHGQKANGRDLKPEEIFSPCAAAALYRRDAFLKVGGFDHSYFCYSEDVDLGFRLRLAGYRCLYVPDAIVHHIGAATTGKDSDFAIYHVHRNLVWTYFKNMPWPLFWLYLPQHLFLNFAAIVWFLVRGRGRVILKAKSDSLKGLPRILYERRRVQARRHVGAWALRRLMATGFLTRYLRRHSLMRPKTRRMSL